MLYYTILLHYPTILRLTMMQCNAIHCSRIPPNLIQVMWCKSILVNGILILYDVVWYGMILCDFVIWCKLCDRSWRSGWWWYRLCAGLEAQQRVCEAWKPHNWRCGVCQTCSKWSETAHDLQRQSLSVLVHANWTLWRPMRLHLVNLYLDIIWYNIRYVYNT